ncbi:unnamed protein product, partial [Ectocarpus sp. 8 AP-2014]
VGSILSISSLGSSRIEGRDKSEESPNNSDKRRGLRTLIQKASHHIPSRNIPTASHVTVTSDLSTPRTNTHRIFYNGGLAGWHTSLTHLLEQHPSPQMPTKQDSAGSESHIDSRAEGISALEALALLLGS